MKCFQVVRDDIIVGLPIVRGTERPYVAIGSERAVLSNELLETQLGDRLMRCRVEVAESGLIVLSRERWREEDYCSVILGLTFERAGADVKIYNFGPAPGKVLLQSSFQLESDWRGQPRSTGALLIANQLGRVEVARRYTEPIAQRAPWYVLGRGPAVTKTYESRPFLELTAKGRLEFSGKPGSGCQVLPPA
ncbi:hypothetical protein KBF38_15880 [bacterium]|nr:hypothetical protein [bacterium]